MRSPGVGVLIEGPDHLSDRGSLLIGFQRVVRMADRLWSLPGRYLGKGFEVPRWHLPAMRNEAAVTGSFPAMIRATWNGAVIAESDSTTIVEGNHYFPPEAVDKRYLSASQSHTRCPWKGTARYYSLVVDGQENQDAAWYYPNPSQAAAPIAGHVAFWRGVRVEEIGEDGSPLRRSVLSRLFGH